MKLSNSAKFNILIGLAFIGIWACNYFRPKKVVDEIVVGDIRVERKPCISVVNGLFGKAVDSLNVCNCVIPKFYDLIRHDSSLVEKFRQNGGMFTLEGPMQDSFILRFVDCVKPNIIDTSAKFQLPAAYTLAFKEKLIKGVKLRSELKNIDPEIFGDCVVQKLNGNITIGEYFADDYFEVSKIKDIINGCMEQSKKQK